MEIRPLEHLLIAKVERTHLAELHLLVQQQMEYLLIVLVAVIRLVVVSGEPPLEYFTDAV